MPTGTFPTPRLTFFDNALEPKPLASGFVYFYSAGGSSPSQYQATYRDADGNDFHENPVPLDAAGQATIFLDPDLTYHMIVKDADGNTIWSVDNLVACP